MTDFEDHISESLHRKLDGVRSSAEIPSTVVRRAKRGRTITASAAAMCVALLLGGGAWLSAGAFERVLDPAAGGSCPFRPAVDLKIYLKDVATRDHVDEIAFLLSSRDEVEGFDYVSKNEAFGEFKERYKDQPEFYENLPQDALPARFDVDLKDGVDPGAFDKSFPRIATEEVRFNDPTGDLCLGDG